MLQDKDIESQLTARRLEIEEIRRQLKLLINTLNTLSASISSIEASLVSTTFISGGGTDLSNLITKNIVPKVTSPGRLGNSSITDNGTTISTPSHLDLTGGAIYKIGGVSGLSTVVTLAKITAGGINGSLVITGGIVTSYTAPI